MRAQNRFLTCGFHSSNSRDRRARCEDRIRNAKDTGLRNLPLHGFT